MVESQQVSADVRRPWTAAILIALAITALYLFMTTRSTLWDRDEPYYARVAVEMVESGNYLVPTFNDRPWLEKPILSYWLMSLAVRLFGPSEFACRFFSAIGTGLTCLLTFFIGKRLFAARAGLWAMVILASTAMVLRVGGSATMDPVLLPIIVAVIAVFVHAAQSGTRAWHVIAMGVAFGAGMLAKGPIGLSPVPVIVATLWLGRRVNPPTWRHVLHVVAALIIGGLIVLAWAIPANNATDGEFYRVFIGRHVISQATKPMQSHGGNILLYLPYYLVVIVVDFFPWTLYLPGAFSAVLGVTVGTRYSRVLLIGWIAPIVVVMTLAATKLPHYVLFVWPALALAAAGTIVGAEKGLLTARDRAWLRRGVWLFGPLVVVAALGVIIAPWALMFKPWRLEVPGMRWSGLAAGIVLLAMATIAIRRLRADRIAASAKALVVGMLVLQIPLQFGFMPAVEQIKLSPPLARSINEKTGEEVPVAAYAYIEPSLNYYLGRHVEQLAGEDAVVAWAQRRQPGVLVISRRDLEHIVERSGSLPLQQIASKRGLNYSKGTTVELLALTRKAGES